MPDDDRVTRLVTDLAGAGTPRGLLAAVAALVNHRQPDATPFASAAKVKKLYGRVEPSTLRKRLNDLQKVLGTGALFDRRDTQRSEYEWTDEGRRVGDRIRQALEELLDRIEEDAVASPSPSPAATVRMSSFNSPTRNFLARALAPLSQPTSEFPYHITFDSNYEREVNASLLLDSPRQLRRYSLVSWPQPAASAAYPTFQHLKLYAWNVLVIVPEGHGFMGRHSVAIEEILDYQAGQQALPLLLSPELYTSRNMLDDVFVSINRFPQRKSLVENPDVVTRFELARCGFGIALAAADAIPATDIEYPIVTQEGAPLAGLYTLSWRPQDGDGPNGVEDVAHQELVRAIRNGVDMFAATRHGVTVVDDEM